MANIWKRRLVNSRGTGIILVFLYVFSTLGIQLSHTCQPFDGDTDHRHSECSGHLLQGDSDVEAHHTTIFNQNNLSEKADPHGLCCPACLYSLTSKTFKLYSNTSLCSTQTVIRTQALPQLSFTKQLECLYSALLRAPPSITS